MGMAYNNTIIITVEVKNTTNDNSHKSRNCPFIFLCGDFLLQKDLNSSQVRN